MPLPSTASRLTVGEALLMPAFRQGGPRVLAGADGSVRTVRWAHVSELPDVASLLRPGDLVLTTGGALPDDDDVDGLIEFVDGLAAVECSALVIELGRRWQDRLPPALVSACERVRLPLVVLTHAVRFANLTQAVGEWIVDDQLAELRDAQRVHDTFTELSFTDAGPPEILEAVQRLANARVVVENAQHRPLDYLSGNEPDAGFLENWKARSARVRLVDRTAWDEPNGWLVTRLGPRHHTWGRLVIESKDVPSQRLVAVAERAAAALAMHRMHSRDRDASARRSHAELIAGLSEHPDSEEWASRARAVGFPMSHRTFVGIIVRPPLANGMRFDMSGTISATLAAVDSLQLAALVCEQDRDVRVLMSAPASAGVNGLVDELARRIGDRRDVVIAAGTPTKRRGDIEMTLREARHVADSVPFVTTGRDRGKAHRLGDTHLRGLLRLLGDDDRLRLFAHRELARVHEFDLAHADRPSTALLPVVKALLFNPTSKSEAAATLCMSRAAFYARLRQLSRLLDADLDDPDVRIALHVALLIQEMDDLGETNRVSETRLRSRHNGTV